MRTWSSQYIHNRVLPFQDTILANATDHDVAFLVGGDPLSATTHTDLILRAVELKVPYKIIHNASIMNAIGSSGLQVRRKSITGRHVYVCVSSCITLVKQSRLSSGQRHGGQRASARKLWPIDAVDCTPCVC